MTALRDDPTTFARDAISGFVATHERYVVAVEGGVVRAGETPAGNVAVIVGGGSGHYPAFAGLVGAGMASGAACGDIFASPSSAQVRNIALECERGGGVLFTFGNYAGDVLNFRIAAEQLAAEGIEVRTVLCTDDIASGDPDNPAQRRGVAGGLVTFKIAGAAAESGMSLDEVERVAIAANSRTRTLGVAFSGCTLPGAASPLFTVPEGLMSVGLGIHGEPGIFDLPMPTRSELAQLLVSRLLEERPPGATVVVPILNGLGGLSYEELFGLFGRIDRVLRDSGLEIFQPECGDLVTSLDMSGVSLTLFWPDAELATLWSAPADSPAYRKTSVWTEGVRSTPQPRAANVPTVRDDATPASRELAQLTSMMLQAVADVVVENSDSLGDIDAIAGDGDHGIGMSRGARAAAASSVSSLEAALGVKDLLTDAAAAWSDKGGGTSGALWGAGLAALGESLGNRQQYSGADAAAASRAAIEAIARLGGATLGDKTMVDAMVPWSAEFTARIDSGDDPVDALQSAADAATRAAHATADLTPRLGRARPLAAKSVGSPDAGAISFALIAGTIATTAAKSSSGRSTR